MDPWQPLVIGIVGSLHCMGMCGPIAVSLPLKENSWSTRVLSAVLYNLGRTLTYAALGLLLGFLGLGIHFWGVQQWVSIGLGTLMILGVAFPVLFHGSRLTERIDAVSGGFRRYFGRFFGLRTYRSTWTIGLLSGLLPCGLVYIALAGALVSTTPWNGALYMALFGLGTAPALFLLSLAGNMAGLAIRRRMRPVIPFLVLLIGVLFVLRGMNLGIPYISPRMAPPVQQTETFQKPECCH